MKTRTINLISVILIAIGAASGLLILYNYNHTPHLISRDQAFAIAVKTGNWSQSFLDNTIPEAKLLHVTNDQYAFLVDEKTLDDIKPHCPPNGSCVEPQEIYGHGYKIGQYIWMIKVTGKPPNILSGREWGYVIDATNGQVLR